MNLAERAGLVLPREVVEDEARKHAVERVVRVTQRVRHRVLEAYISSGPLGFSPGDLQFLQVTVDASYLGVRVLLLGEKGKGGRAAAEVEDAVAEPYVGLPDEASLVCGFRQRPPDDHVVERGQQVVTERRHVFV